MRRFPWVSVALLVVLGLLAALTYGTFGAGGASDEARSDAADGYATPYVWVGGVCAALALVIGALGVWARAPATLPTALGIIGAGAFMGAWLARMAAAGDLEGFRLGMALSFMGVLVAFATSARRVAVPEPLA